MQNAFLKKLNELTCDKFDFLRLTGVDINVAERTIDMKFIYPAEKSDYVAENRDEIVKAVKEVLDSAAAVNVHLSAARFDIEYCRQKVAEFFVKFPSVAPFADCASITADFGSENGKIRLEIPVGGDAYEYCAERKIASELKEYLKLCFTDDISPEFTLRTDGQIGEDDFLHTGEANFSADGERLIRPGEIRECAGKPITDPAIYIEDCTAKTGETVVLCGKVSAYRELQKSDGSKTFYKFTLTDFTGSEECLIFPNKTLSPDKISAVSDGSEIVIRGQVKENSFRGEKSTSVFVRSISFCKLPENFVKNEIYRVTPEAYVHVFPVPYSRQSQGNLFEQDTAADVPPYIAGKTYVVYDFETTGLDVSSCKIIEIGAVKIVDGKFTETFSTLVDPDEKLSPHIIDTTHITDEMLRGMPSIEQVFPDFNRFCDGAVLVGHNSNDFDGKILARIAKEQKFRFSDLHEDTMVLAKKVLHSVHNYKLRTVAKYFGIINETAHRALGDAVTTAKVFVNLSAMM